MAKGEIAHIEIPADDPERARRFYQAVVGWEFGAMDAFPGYWMARTGDASGAGLGRRGETVGPVLRIYITVDSLEPAVEAASANGGTVVESPKEIGGGMGRFAVVHDPEGNEIGLWEAPAAG